MATNERDEALTVVIEKLTEIVGEIDHVPDQEDLKRQDAQSSEESGTLSGLPLSSDNSDQQASKFKEPTKVQPKVVTNQKGERTVVLTTTDDSSDKAERQVVLNFPVRVGNLNIENPEGLIQTLQNLNYALETGKATPQKLPVTQNNAKKDTFKCAKCDYSSHNKHYLKQHVELVHNAERPFKCPFCDYAGKRSHSLKEHLVVHSSYRPFECNLCNATFRKKGHLTNHIRMHSTKKTIVCEFCKKACNEQPELYKHLREEHADNNTYECDVCEYVATVKSNIIMHMHGHGNPKTFICQTCNFVAIHAKIMVEHIQENHDGDGAYVIEPYDKSKAGPVIFMKCSQCGFTTDDRSVLTSHMWEHINNETDNQETAESSPGPSNVSTRQPEETPPAAVPTAQSTEKDAPSASTSKVSESKTSVPTLYHCAQCNYSSSEAYVFITHMLSHKPNMPKSDITPEPVPSSSSTKVTEATQGKPFVHDAWAGVYRCSICNYTCELQRTIKAHIWKHIGNNDIDYPMFQNGPLSVYDDTPIGVPMLLGGKAPVATVSAPTTPGTSLQSSTVAQEVKASEFVPASQNEEAPHVGMMVTVGGSPETRSSSAKIVQSPQILEPVTLSSVAQEDADKQPVPKRIRIPQNATVVMKPASKRKPNKPAEESTSIAKRLRSQNKVENVVVQQVSQVYTTPELDLNSSGQVVSQAPSPESTISASSSPSAQSITGDPTTVVSDVNTVNIVRDEALLPEHCVEVEVRAEIPDAGGEEGDDGSHKTGICKSLLAVIEQLRERSKSESEDDSGTSSKGGRGRRKKASAAEVPDAPLDTNFNVETIDGQFRCKLCHYTSQASSVMSSHMKLHKAKKPSQCSLCNYEAGSSEDLQDHVLKHCKVRTYQCKQCSSSFSYKSQLRAHMRAHNERAPFSCIHCPFQTIDPVVFANHGKEHLQTIHICSTCGQKFDTKSELDRHVQGKCHGKEVLKCDECEFTSINRESYRKHMRWHGKAYKCERCEFSSTNYTEFKSHSRTHEEEQELKCDLCDFIASSTRSLKSHMKRHVNDQRFVQQPLEQYKCNMCGYVCHHLPSLKSHMWRHASDASYSYENTNEVINAAIDYDSRTEEEKREKGKAKSPDCLVTFRCCQCGYETVDKSKLNQHMKSHMDIIKKTLEVNKGRVPTYIGSQAVTAEGDSQSCDETLRATESVVVTESGDGGATGSV